MKSSADGVATIMIDVEPVDTSGRLLRLHTDRTSDPAVASLDVTVGRRVIRLDVLAASHRVALLDRPASDRLASDRPASDSSVVDRPTSDRPVSALSGVDPPDADGCAALVTETVACVRGGVPASPAELPRRSGWVAGGWTMEFHSTLTEGVAAVAAGRAAAEAAVAAGQGLIARFPGSADAVTALAVTAAADSAIAWSTWHLYPGADPHVVHTSTVATLTPGRP